MGWSKEQVDEFLTGEPRMGRLATVSGDGEPRVAPVWFRHDGDRLLVHSMEDSSKVRNALATGRFSMTVDKDDAPYAGVILTGKIEVLAADEYDFAELVNACAVKYLGPELGGPMGAMIAGMPGGHVTLALTPETWDSWDYSQM